MKQLMVSKKILKTKKINHIQKSDPNRLIEGNLIKLIMIRMILFNYLTLAK